MAGKFQGMAFGGGSRPMSEIMFEKYDTDKNGCLDHKVHRGQHRLSVHRLRVQEFEALCFAMGYALRPAEVETSCKMLDTDGSGVIEKNGQ